MYINTKFKIKAAHYGGDIKKRDEVVGNTANMIQHLADIGAMLAHNSITASEVLNNAVHAEHTQGIHTSHNEQNN